MSLKSIFTKGKPYIIFALINLVFFMVPLACNFYVDDTKIEAVAQKIADVAKETGKEDNSVAVTIKSPAESKINASENFFGVDVSKYNGLFVNPLQLSDGILLNDVTFSYNGIDLNGIRYALSSGNWGYHQGVRGTLQDKYQIYLYKADSNANKHGCDNFCYITERTAAKMMASNSSLQNYDDLINEVLTVRYENVEYTWSIGNIILDKEEFYDQMSNIYGDFILAYVCLPGNLGKNVCLSAYFGSNTYLNINKMSSLHSLENPTYEIYRDNLESSEITVLDEIDSFLNGFHKKQALTVVYYIEIGVLAAIGALCAWLYLKRKSTLKFSFLLVSLILSLGLAYAPFWAAYSATRNIIFLSNAGVIGTIIVFVALSVATLIIIWAKGAKKREKI